MPKLRRFIIRKYVMAENAKQAIQRERKVAVDEVYVDEKQPVDGSASAIGFTQPQEPEWREDEVLARRKK